MSRHIQAGLTNSSLIQGDSLEMMFYHRQDNWSSRTFESQTNIKSRKYLGITKMCCYYVADRCGFLSEII